MENDYLWDKSGEDKEIEKLENALKEFRYQPISAPILPVKVLQIEEKPKFSFFGNYFRFASAGFACLAILLIGLGIFLNSLNNSVSFVESLTMPIIAPIKYPNEPFVQPIIVRKESQPTKKIVRITESKPMQTKYIISSKPSQIVFRQKSIPKIKPSKEVKLTEEEKYAYNQLMLALSITGSKLKEVKEKVNGDEESSSDIKKTQ